jgi:hypothetical protein
MKFITLGISGKKGVGKNYVSEQIVLPWLLENLSIKYPGKVFVPYFFSFGTCIKAELYSRNIFLKTSDLLGSSKTKEIRQLLQQYGTEFGRNAKHESIWIRQIQFWMETQLQCIQHSPISSIIIPIFVISDIRFINELEFVSSLPNSLVLRVVSHERHLQACKNEGQDESLDTHISERDLDNHLFQYYIFNDSTHDVRDQSVQILTNFISDTLCFT